MAAVEYLYKEITRDESCCWAVSMSMSIPYSYYCHFTKGDYTFLSYQHVTQWEHMHNRLSTCYTLLCNAVTVLGDTVVILLHSPSAMC